ncbi:MAG: hypothetical protein MI920_15940 [Kiloniellales bacterium]|nr:hypothetical protein [Kiloniellales bacterium]
MIDGGVLAVGVLDPADPSRRELLALTDDGRHRLVEDLYLFAQPTDFDDTSHGHLDVKRGAARPGLATFR